MLTGLERPGLPLDIDRSPSKPVHPQVSLLYHRRHNRCVPRPRPLKGLKVKAPPRKQVCCSIQDVEMWNSLLDLQFLCGQCCICVLCVYYDTAPFLAKICNRFHIYSVLTRHHNPCYNIRVNVYIPAYWLWNTCDGEKLFRHLL